MRHLLTKEKVDSSSGLMEQSIRRECAAVLSLNADEVAENVPLSSYGLDSLTSVRLSGILKAKFNITVTQLQLLSNFMTGEYDNPTPLPRFDILAVERLHVLQKEQKATAASEVKTLIATHENVEAVARPGVAHELDLSKTVVRLNGASGDQPLFILHGAGGGVLVMLKMAQKITLPVYGVQDTPEAPIHGTLEQLSRFYLGKIKDTQPEGPYRLGGFSFGQKTQ
jgi:acyl carrier protein